MGKEKTDKRIPGTLQEKIFIGKEKTFEADEETFIKYIHRNYIEYEGTAEEFFSKLEKSKSWYYKKMYRDYNCVPKDGTMQKLRKEGWETRKKNEAVEQFEGLNFEYGEEFKKPSKKKTDFEEIKKEEKIFIGKEKTFEADEETFIKYIHKNYIEYEGTAEGFFSELEKSKSYYYNKFSFHKLETKTKELSTKQKGGWETRKGNEAVEQKTEIHF